MTMKLALASALRRIRKLASGRSATRLVSVPERRLVKMINEKIRLSVRNTLTQLRLIVPSLQGDTLS
jgi:hypothetical protein